MPIEVPDTRAFADPPPRRRRKPAAPVEVAAPAEAPAGTAFSKPVRRRRAATVVDPPAAAPVAEAAVPEAPVAESAVPEAPAAPASAFSRPVRRRPRTAPVPEQVAPARVAEDAVPALLPEQAVSPLAPEPALRESVEPVERVIVDAAVVAPAPSAQDEDDEVVVLTDAVVVRLAGTRYSVDMDAVAEVGRPPHVTRVPGVPSWIAGVANWRGRVLPVIDLRVLLGAPVLDLGVSGRILVMTREGVTLGFLAERVEGVVSLPMDTLEPVLSTLSRTTASILTGQLAHADGPIAVLDLETIFGLRSQLPRVRRAG